MKYTMLPIQKVKNIALVAHDNKKNDLIEWARWNKTVLQNHKIFATGTTGRLLEDVLEMSIVRFQSGPLGGDQQIGSHITEGKIDFLIFFWDPLEPQPHDPDVKALLRIALVWNIPSACNRATADFMISSVLMDKPYSRMIQDFSEYQKRKFSLENEAVEIHCRLRKHWLGENHASGETLQALWMGAAIRISR